MGKISRRKFVKNTTGITAGLTLLGGNAVSLCSCDNKRRILESLKVFIPMPVQVVIDDVGWWSGEDGSTRQEPYRTGINRNHIPADYQAIVDIGRSLGIRPQAATILCEWDKDNILKQLPTSTWMGERWDNSKWVGPWLEEAAEIIRNNEEYFELTLHGVGHEYWEHGKFTRAEWHDSEGHMRPRDEVEKHLEFYQQIMEQHDLGPFPKSFVPSAFRHSFGTAEGNDISLASILKSKGITYINTPFQSMYNKQRVQYGLFGFDDEVMTIDRGRDEFSWTTFPGDPSKELTGPTCGMHWPNMLHPDPERNCEVVQKWSEYLKTFNDKPEMMLAEDSVEFQNQLAHNSLTKFYKKNNYIELDFTETDKLPGGTGKSGLTIKIYSKIPLQFKFVDIKFLSQSVKNAGEYIYSLRLLREKEKLTGKIAIN